MLCMSLTALIYRNRIHRKKLAMLATTDELTGLFNRRQTLAHLDKHIAETESNKKSFSLAIVDIDSFNHVNDKFGYFTGDKILRLFAELSLKYLAEHYVIGRMGGDRFFILMPDTDGQVAYSALDHLRQKLEDVKQEVNMPDLILSISVGLCEYNMGDSAESVIRLANTALYRAKKTGKDNVVLCARMDEPPLQ